jgi:hypothetical protein
VTITRNNVHQFPTRVAIAIPLDDYHRLADEYIAECYTGDGDGRLTAQLLLSAFLLWLRARREKEMDHET